MPKKWIGFNKLKKSRDFSSKRNGLANQNLAFFYINSRMNVWICQEESSVGLENLIIAETGSQPPVSARCTWKSHSTLTPLGK